LFLGGAVDASVGGDVASDVGVLPGPSGEWLDEVEDWCFSVGREESEEMNGNGNGKAGKRKMYCGNVPTRTAGRQSCSGSQ
jgi:hypothetical protein